MDKRMLIEFIISWLIIILGGILIILPIFKIVNIKLVFILVISLIGIIYLIKNLLLLKDKEYSGIKIFIASIIMLILAIFIDINTSPWNLALSLFIWIVMLSLIKLKIGDYYHDRNNKIWIMHILCLILFIIVGILTTLSLYYPSDIQILVMGYFILIMGLLEVVKPITAYLIIKK